MLKEIHNQGWKNNTPAPKLSSFLTSSFLSSDRKVTALYGTFHLRRKEYSDDESMAQFVRRRLGEEALNYAANPFVGGIYASRPESLVLKHAFPTLLEMENIMVLFSVQSSRRNKTRRKLPKQGLFRLKVGCRN